MANTRVRNQSNGFGGAALFASALLCVLVVLFASAVDAKEPKRVVSLNLCTDQLVMMLAPPGNIAALSFLSRFPDMSVMAKEAAKFPITNATAEEVFVLEPDLVIASTFTERATVDILRRVGIRVEEFAPASSFDDIRTNMRRLGDLLQAQERAGQLIADFDAELRRLKTLISSGEHDAALYYANGYSSGSDTLAAEVVSQAGFENLATRLGVRGMTKLPLETLIMQDPDLLITGPKEEAAPALAQEILHHPALGYIQGRSDLAPVADQLWICGTPHVLKAVAQLIESKRKLDGGQTAMRPEPTHRPAQ